jgi:ankyrin repeat protein
MCSINKIIIFIFSFLSMDFALYGADSITLFRRAVSIGSLQEIECELSRAPEYERQKLVNAHGEFSMAPLHLAVVRGELKIVKYLVEHGAQLDVKDEIGVIPLHIAISSRPNYGVAKYFLEYGDKPESKKTVNVRDNVKRTALHRAAICGELAFVKLLVENDAEINPQDVDGNTPLHDAISSGDQNYEMIAYLLEKGADLDCTTVDCDKMTPLKKAIKGCGNHKIIKLFLSKNPYVINNCNAEGNTLLHECAKYSFCNYALKLFFEHSSDIDIHVNAKNKKGETPLHCAARSQNLLAIETLLKEGADLSIQDVNGKTPLDVFKEADCYLSAYKKQEFIQLLTPPVSSMTYCVIS